MKHNKFNSRKVHVDGHTFDSKVEYYYYLKLKDEGYDDFQIHEPFEILEPYKIGKKKHRPRRYTPDFILHDDKGNLSKVIDVKGAKTTDAASLRMDLFTWQYRCPVTIARYDYKKHVFKEHEK